MAALNHNPDLIASFFPPPPIPTTMTPTPTPGPRDGLKQFWMEVIFCSQPHVQGLWTPRHEKEKGRHFSACAGFGRMAFHSLLFPSGKLRTPGSLLQLGGLGLKELGHCGKALNPSTSPSLSLQEKVIKGSKNIKKKIVESSDTSRP